MIVPVVLSGGSGSRLWPLSRDLFPKQLLPLTDRRTMLQNTVLRLSGLEGVANPLVVCNQNHRFMVAEQLRAVERTAAAIILEPVGRNTAPAVAVAALQALKADSEAILLVLPADHVILDEELFCRALEKGREFAEDGKLVTFGVVPDAPETGYGYIKAGEELEVRCDRKITSHASPITGFNVDRFVEKPDAKTAENYLKTGGFYWNSGIFMFKASRFLEELGRLGPEMLGACERALDKAHLDLDFTRLDIDEFSACPSDSIDYAVMEKTDDAVVVPLAARWNDVGSWSALWDIGDKDEHGNVTTGDILAHDTSNCYLHSTGRLIATVGLRNQVIVETTDAILVADKNQVQDVKKLVEALKKTERSEAVTHREVQRPWGAYESIGVAERYQVKRITVKPGGSLSHQLHHHRAEHWIVVKGTAKITKGDEVLVISENESTYIPLGTAHRLENPGKIPLELIEVQSGSYLGEDDIVRFDDVYGR
jgi:mannose-1-phosphate guanylyltransferase/mannose-6-phosphate isomerase